MADLATVACASAAAAAANACGLPTDVSLVAALGGAAVSLWLQNGVLTELTLRGVFGAVMHVLMSACVGLAAGPMVPVLWPQFALVPAFVPVVLSSLAAHWLVALAGRVIGRLGGASLPADRSGE